MVNKSFVVVGELSIVTKEPDTAFLIFDNFKNFVVAKVRLGGIVFKIFTVKPAYSTFRGDPDIAFAVLNNIVADIAG